MASTGGNRQTRHRITLHTAMSEESGAGAKVTFKERELTGNMSFVITPTRSLHHQTEQLKTAFSTSSTLNTSYTRKDATLSNSQSTHETNHSATEGKRCYTFRNRSERQSRHSHSTRALQQYTEIINFKPHGTETSVTYVAASLFKDRWKVWSKHAETVFVEVGLEPCLGQ